MTVVVFQDVGAVTHVSASATEYWYSTEAMPDGLATRVGLDGREGDRQAKVRARVVHGRRRRRRVE